MTKSVGGGLVSIVVPVFNESASLERTYRDLTTVMSSTGRTYELLFVNDGSSDDSALLVKRWRESDEHVHLVDLSRNFGKEIALTAGIRASSGEAVIMIDADGQHPPAVIVDLLAAWDEGAEVVVGVREGRSGQTPLKRASSWLYYRILNSIAETKVLPGSTDFRLLDREVVDQFDRFTERNRLTRGLVDWLGYRRAYVFFRADVRAEGKATYSLRKLVRLALDSFVSASLLPLKIAGYLGSFITLVAAVAAVILIFDEYVFDDPLGGRFTSAGILAIFIVFLVGIILSCLGLIALYIANIHTEVVNRPLFIVRRDDLETGADASTVRPSPVERLRRVGS